MVMGSTVVGPIASGGLLNGSQWFFSVMVGCWVA